MKDKLNDHNDSDVNDYLDFEDKIDVPLDTDSNEAMKIDNKNTP